jgi:hypothetical protein
MIPIPMIEKEIFKKLHYQGLDKFDYLTSEVPFSYYIWLIVIVAWWQELGNLCAINDVDKVSSLDNLIQVTTLMVIGIPHGKRMTDATDNRKGAYC